MNNTQRAENKLRFLGIPTNKKITQLSPEEAEKFANYASGEDDYFGELAQYSTRLCADVLKQIYDEQDENE